MIAPIETKNNRYLVSGEATILSVDREDRYFRLVMDVSGCRIHLSRLTTSEVINPDRIREISVMRGAIIPPYTPDEWFGLLHSAVQGAESHDA